MRGNGRGGVDRFKTNGVKPARVYAEHFVVHLTGRSQASCGRTEAGALTGARLSHYWFAHEAKFQSSLRQGFVLSILRKSLNRKVGTPPAAG